MSVEPGWYPDPAEPTTQRYWDGEGWIGAPLPVDATPPSGPPPDAPVPAPAPAPVQPVVPVPANPPPGQWTHPGTPVMPPGAVPPGAVPPGAVPPPGWPGAGPAQPGWPPPGQLPPGWPARPHLVPVMVPPPRPHGLKLAAFGPRLAARLIDLGLLLLLNILVNGWFIWRYAQEVAPVFREIMRRSMAGDPSSEGIPQAGEQAGGLQVAILLIAMALWFAYEVPTTAESGQSLGKRLMGIKVVALADEPRIGFGRSVRRWSTMGLAVPLWTCCLGFLIQFVDFVFPLFDRPLRQALHDKRAQTVVVQVPREPRRPGKPADDRVTTPGGSA